MAYKTKTAETAAWIRKELKSKYPDVKFRVHSRIFSGGDAVDVEWIDGPKEQEVRRFLSKYQYGYFDPMEDLYKYSNVKKDIPQVKYVQTRRELSPQYAVEVLKRNGFDVSEEELHKTNKEVFDKYRVWTFYNLAFKLDEKWEELWR